ncbi:MAG TPA: hypothetical protein VFB15_07905 [Candidatus Binataceae bacterium]|jgi:hypothetical protein|nr:hypothetical protein [Candidatus Binataceae bacterium]
MSRTLLIAVLLALAGGCLAACGLVYDTSAGVRGARMEDSLKVGESSLEVHDKWGEPDIRTNAGDDTQVWSYVTRPNSNDVAASLLYTSTKPGDTGKFLDLKFVDGKLVSWNSVEHTVPPKQGMGFSYGLGPVGGSAPVTHY